MALTGINIKETFECSSAQDKDVNNPTIFVFSPLKNADKIEVMSSAYGDDMKFDVKALMRESFTLVKKSLTQIKNFNGRDYKKEEITDDLLDSLHVMVISEIGSKIIEKNFLQVDEAKN